MTYIPYLGTFFSHGTPVWPWPVTNKTGDEPRKQDTQANKRSPLLSEAVPDQISLIGLSQGRLDRRRREKVIWEMFTENDCYTFADLEGKS